MGTKGQIEDFFSNYPEYKPSVGLYNPDKDVIESIRADLNGLEIKVFYGDWCPDCRLQLPRFISVVLALDTEDLDIGFIEVKRSMDDGLGRAYEMNVLAVPTFVFLQDGREIGRIIERPRVSIEWDFAETVK